MNEPRVRGAGKGGESGAEGGRRKKRQSNGEEGEKGRKKEFEERRRRFITRRAVGRPGAKRATMGERKRRR